MVGKNTPTVLPTTVGASPTEELAKATRALESANAHLAESLSRPGQESNSGRNAETAEHGSISEPKQPIPQQEPATPRKPLPAASEAERFHEQLEQAGQLVDVTAADDLSALPPHVTHVRQPDGSVRRIGFS